MSATLSILGLYNWRNDLFDAMKVPDGVDREEVVENLCLECAEFEVLYTDPDFMYMAIGTWSKKQLPVWEKLYATTNLDYDPIANYDRTEEWTDTTTVSGSGKSTNNGTDKTVNGTSAFNDTSGTYTPTTNVEVNLGTGNETESTGTSANSKMGRAYGNIGVMSTQQMIEQERNVDKFNIIDYIITDFKRRFCLLIY